MKALHITVFYKTVLISTITVYLIFSNCSENSSGTEPEPPPPDYNETLSGQVLLENQPEHSNALIYIDGLNIGARTDSGGYFKLQFPDSVRDRSGVFTVYYFVEDYDLNSAKIEMKDGDLLEGVWDVDTTGNLPLKEMKQILQVEGWTDKQEYRIGDMLHLQLTMRNLSKDTLQLVIYSAFNDFGAVSLWRDKTFPHYLMSPYDPVMLDLHIYLFHGGFYEGNVSYPVPYGVWISDSLWSLLPADYSVVAGFEFEDRGYPIPPQIRKYIEDEWRADPEAITGLYMFYTSQKYKYPKVSIIP